MGQLQSNETICILPWVHHYISQNHDVRPCCTGWKLRLGNITKNPLSYVDKDIPMQTLRQQMRNGIQPEACLECFQREEDGNRSPRQEFNQLYQEELTKVLHNKPVKKKYLEVNFSNLCNARCKSCSPLNSTQWYETARKLEGWGYYNDQGKLPHKVDWDKIDIDWQELDLIKILGGEPFMHPDNEKIIQRIFDKGQPEKCSLEVFTNASIFPDNNIIEALKRFKHVEINLSIDGLRETYEYIRTGLNFNKVLEVIAKWNEVDIPNKRLGFQMLVQVDNILQVTEYDKFFKEFVNYNGNTEKSYMHYSILTNPIWLRPRNASDNNKVKAIKYLDTYMETAEGLHKRDYAKFKTIIKELQQPAEDRYKLEQFNKTFNGTP